jgi:hypothetical protein
MLRPLPLPLRTPGLLKLSMPSGVTIALTAGIGAAAGAATGAAATTDHVTTMDRATDLTAGTGGDVVVAIGGVVTTGETDPVAAHARYHSRLQSGFEELMIAGGRKPPEAPGRRPIESTPAPDAVAARLVSTVSPGAQLRYTRVSESLSPWDTRRRNPVAASQTLWRGSFMLTRLAHLAEALTTELNGAAQEQHGVWLPLS